MDEHKAKGEMNRKKAAALLVSVLFTVGTFILLFCLSMGKDMRWFLFGVPLLHAAYFVSVGNLLAHRLGLSRWALWLCMAFIGGLCSWSALLICFPTLLFNGFFLIFLVPMAGISAAVWVFVGLGFLIAKASSRSA